MDVQELLGRHVDVVTTPALRHRLRRDVIEAAVPL
jgi:predicted nucleotidyltransferase